MVYDGRVAEVLEQMVWVEWAEMWVAGRLSEVERDYR
jgi:hypothetical protein